MTSVKKKIDKKIPYASQNKDNDKNYRKEKKIDMKVGVSNILLLICL